MAIRDQSERTRPDRDVEIKAPGHTYTCVSGLCQAEEPASIHSVAFATQFSSVLTRCNAKSSAQPYLHDAASDASPDSKTLFALAQLSR